MVSISRDLDSDFRKFRWAREKSANGQSLMILLNLSPFWIAPFRFNRRALKKRIRGLDTAFIYLNRLMQFPMTSQSQSENSLFSSVCWKENRRFRIKCPSGTFSAEKAKSFPPFLLFLWSTYPGTTNIEGTSRNVQTYPHLTVSLWSLFVLI